MKATGLYDFGNGFVSLRFERVGVARGALHHHEDDVLRRALRVYGRVRHAFERTAIHQQIARDGRRDVAKKHTPREFGLAPIRLAGNATPVETESILHTRP